MGFHVLYEEGIFKILQLPDFGHVSHKTGVKGIYLDCGHRVVTDRLKYDSYESSKLVAKKPGLHIQLYNLLH